MQHLDVSRYYFIFMFVFAFSQVSVAVELCSKYLEMALTTENCTDILNLAQMYSLTSTQSKALQYMMDNFMVS